MLNSLPATVRPSVERYASHQLIRKYCEWSFAYYHHDISLTTDAEYDEVCRYLYDNFKKVKLHDVDNYLERDQLHAGSGFAVELTGQTLVFAKVAVHQYYLSRGRESESPYDDDPDVLRVMYNLVHESRHHHAKNKPGDKKPKTVDLDFLDEKPKAKKPKKLDLDSLFE